MQLLAVPHAAQLSFGHSCFGKTYVAAIRCCGCSRQEESADGVTEAENKGYFGGSK